MKKRFLPLVLLFALILATSVVQAQGETPEDPLAVLGTGFTYQGWLSDDAGSPLNGTCDFNFSLWDGLSDGAQVGAVSPVTNVAVAEGYFSAVVNGAAEFGSNAFKGSARWLEISLRCPAGAGSYTTLSPRQALTAAPYARYAVNAPWSGLSGVPADLADGDNDTTYAAGTGITLSGGAFSLGTAYRLPQSCTDGQIAEWDTGTSAWVCAADNSNSGDITGVTAGDGLTGGGTSSEVTLALGTTYQLPQNCTNGQPTEWNNIARQWTCATDDNTTYAAGTGITLSGGAFSLGTAYRLPQSCADGKIAEWDTGTSLWTCGTDDNTTYTAGSGLTLASGAFSVNFGGNGTAATSAHSDHTHSTFWLINGNTQTDPAINYIGTRDDTALVFKVNGQRALLIEPNSTSPNLIGGYSGNSATNGAIGATIGGGGDADHPNVVTDGFGTVGGGRSNSASLYATVSGGNTNTADAIYATVSGGYLNTAGFISTVGGGYGNTASGDYATIPGGNGAVASQYGQMANANGYFADYGDAQTSTYILWGDYTNTDYNTLTLDNYGAHLNVDVGQSMTFEILVVGRTEAGETAGYRFEGVIENIGGTTAFIGTPNKTVLGEDDSAWDARLINAFDNLEVLVKGNGVMTRWVAMVRTVEVAWIP